MRRAILTCVMAATGLVASGCHSTFIELNPDAPRDGGSADDAEPADGAAEVGDVEVGDAEVGDAEVGEHPIILPPPPCGNGELDDGEECDDGNREDRDGCTWDCLLGDGDPVGPPDPSARPYVAQGPPVVLPAVESPPVGLVGWMNFAAIGGTILVPIWHRPESPLGTPGTISARFLRGDGTLARDDVRISLTTGWTLTGLTEAASDTDVLLAWRAGADAIWRARLTVEDGLVEAPAMLVVSPDSDLPALAGRAGGYAFAWYDGNDTMRCVHDGPGPSRVLLARLGTDGGIDESFGPAELEPTVGAWTSPRLARGSDSSVGLLWWRADTEHGDDCQVRFGVADPALAVIADGGVLGAGPSGRIVEAEDAYRVVWRRAPDAAPPGLGFAAFDRGAMLLDAPVTCDLPFEAFWGDVEMAAGDHGLLTVFRGWDAGLEQRLFFVRTDLLGRTGDASCGAFEVDPSCTVALGCVPGPFGVAWAADAFVVVYFVTLGPGGPAPTTEMRMVRLVAAP